MKLKFWVKEPRTMNELIRERDKQKAAEKLKKEQETQNANKARLQRMDKVFASALATFPRREDLWQNFTEYFVAKLRLIDKDLADIYSTSFNQTLNQASGKFNQHGQYYTFYFKDPRPPEHMFKFGCESHQTPASYFKGKLITPAGQSGSYTYTIALEHNFTLSASMYPIKIELEDKAGRIGRTGFLQFPHGLLPECFYSCEYKAENNNKKAFEKANTNHDIYYIRNREHKRRNGLDTNATSCNLSTNSINNIFNEFKEGILGHNNLGKKFQSRTHFTTDRAPAGILKMREFLLTQPTDISAEAAFKGLKDTLHAHYSTKSYLSLFGFNSRINHLTRDKSIEKLYSALDNSKSIEEFVTSTSFLNFK